MGDAWTNLAASSLDQTAYNRAVDYALREDLRFVQVADVRPTAQSMPGTAVVFTLESDLAIQSTALNESTDPDAIANTDSIVTLTLAEYGAATIRTQKLMGTSFVPFDPIVANIISRNAAESLDELASIQLRGGSNVVYATGGATTPTARNTVESTDTITAADVRNVRARLKGNVAPTWTDRYVAFIHPDVVYDLQGDTGADGWVLPVNYSDATRRWSGETGTFAGHAFIETSRAPVFADAGSSTTLTDVYATIFVGRQALAKAFSSTGGWGENPMVVARPPTDKLMRFYSLGWKWLGVFGRFREACLDRIESSSSIGTNA